MKKICFLRHSGIGVEYSGRYIGRTNVGLSEEGILDAQNLRLRLPKRFQEAIIFTSPAIRVKETLDLFITREHPSIEKEELSELDFGEWEGKNSKELWMENPESLRNWASPRADFRFPGGESLSEFRTRARIMKEFLIELDDSNILIVSHGGILSEILSAFLGLKSALPYKFRLAPSGFATIDLYRDGSSILTDLVRTTETRRSEWPN